MGESYIQLLCARCGVNPRITQSYCRECHNAFSRESRRRYAKKYQDQTKVWKQANPERVKELNRESLKRQKSALFALLGDKCCKCGFTDERALQIDHINGARGERGSTYRSGSKLYAAILRGDKNISDFQLLCANCNWIKRSENNECSPEKVYKYG